MKRLPAYITLVILCSVASAQTRMFINKTNGTADSLLLSDIKSISFKTYSPPTGGLTSLFKFVKEVKVTPAGNLIGGGFVRIGYVPGRDRIVVTFKAKLDQPGSCLGIEAYAYREYTEDMVETGNDGIINCQAGPDVGGLFVGDDFYYASMGRDNTNTLDGWYLTKYNAVTWTSLVNTFFHPLAAGEDPGDPMLAYVNGQIDISSTYRGDPPAQPGPLVSFTTHHQFFTTDLKFVSKKVLQDTPHINLSSLVTVGNTINFVTGTALLGDLIVMRYDLSWNYLDTRTLKLKSAAPEGAAFDGSRFYVCYLDVPGTSFPAYDNVRLAAFDSNWNLLDDIAVTSFTSQDLKQPNRPTLTLRNGRIYVCYDETENETRPPPPIEQADTQVYVKVYDVSSK